MNKSHRNKLERFREKLSAMRDELDAMSVAYADKYDNAREKWHESEAGQECDALREQLELAAAEVKSAESVLADLCA